MSSRALAPLLLACVLASPVRAESVELSVLTYNVHGLFACIARDDPKGRLPEIARRLEAYDVALIQEDWSYHDLLTEHAVHESVERGNGSRRLLGLVPFLGGSGLTTLARGEPGPVVGAVAEGYGECSGWLRGANDCLAHKGFLLLRLRLAAGLEVDVVQTHLDAGGGDGDHAARDRQLAQLERRLHELASGRALIVAGDLNLGGDVEEDRVLIERLVSSVGLADSGAGGGRGPDYILYRSGEDVALELLHADVATEFVHEGEPLSDHLALFARFRLAPEGGVDRYSGKE